MGFQSVNELQKFNFDDCVVNSMKVNGEEIILEVEALIVRKNNSQNTNFTESYAGPTTIRLYGASIIYGVKDGYKYYDAAEVLISEKQDEVLENKEIEKVMADCGGAYLYGIDEVGANDSQYETVKSLAGADQEVYVIGIEYVDELNTMEDSYRIYVTFEKSVVNWEFYMNRVQN